MATATLLVELLTEELPPKSLRLLGDRFAAGVADALAKAGFIPAGTVAKMFATPRRLAVAVPDVLALQPDQVIERKGPAVAAGHKDGQPTPALSGFARACGIEVDRLERTGSGKTEQYVFRTTKRGEPLDAHLAGIVEAALKALPAPKLMRWGASDVEFVRPVHRLTMLHGSRVVPGTVLGLASGHTTLGHRFLGAGEIVLNDADAYEATLLERGKVVASFDRRADAIRKELAAATQGARLADESLVEEVTALVEYPAVYAGHFESEFLSVPQECLMLTMKANQKYFPLLDADGRLIERFLVVSNMAIDDATNIVRGNERVIRARLSDAKFFYDQDRRARLESHVERLGEVVYHNKLGSQLARTRRIERLAEHIANLLGTDAPAARRAALLCKADLLTGMVGEFPELQGVMGMYYARHDGERDLVANAIEAHYRPRFAGDALPADRVGDCVALADKLDTLAGIYGIGFAPTGDKDPFGLRRAALGVLRILAEHDLPLDLHALLVAARDGHAGNQLSASVADDVFAFMLDRLRSYLRDRGYAIDEIEAVVAQDPRRIDTVVPRLAGVRAFGKLPEAAALAGANKRISNILKKSGVAASIDPARLVEPEERALFARLTALEPTVESQLGNARFEDALVALAGMRGEVDAFFDKVLVNAEDAALRANRLGLLTRLNTLMNRVADISKLA